ncbi:MAG: PrsW family glutamic-type intramembrane protease [Saprospiraceae bacterium]|nr:PrsW family glutamic-type intramembrane protease [Saprospiraceae bacterium]
MSLIFLLALALAPGMAIALYIYLKDADEPEPLRPLIMGLSFGVLAFGISIGLGLLLSGVTDIREGDFIQQMIKAFIFVGLIEEGSKFLFLRGVMYRNPNFNEPFDGIVYAVMIGMGFATAENILYVVNGDAGTAIIRMFTAVPAHAVFAVIMGFFVGEAKVFPTSAGLYAGIGLFLATFVHGVYDYFLFISFVPGLWIQAIISLIIAVVLSHFAMKRHQGDSRFKSD